MDYYGFINENEKSLEVFINKRNKLTLNIRDSDDDEQDVCYVIEDEDIDKVIEVLKVLKRHILLKDK